MARQSRPQLILTRPAQASHRFAADLAARLGPLDILISPLMAPEWIASPLPATVPDGVIFTSETGVAALSARVGWRVQAICVGPQTALVARQNGWPAEVVGPDAAHMVAALAAAPLKGHWLHARGEDAAAPLASLLGDLGMQMDEAVLYSQVPQPLSAEAAAAFAQTDRPLLVAVFSPRSARLLVSALQERSASTLWLAAISPAAAAVMEPLGPRRVVVAQSPDGAGMLDAVESLLSTDA